MSPNHSNQSRSTVGGHQSGRDTNVHTTHIHGPPCPSRIQLLREKFRTELLNNDTFRDTIDHLQYYLDCVDGDDHDPIVGLQQKLTLADRSDQLDKATRLKEFFRKNLQKHMLSRSAQEIYAYLLGRLDELFDNHIMPLICDNASRPTIDEAVSTKVITPISEEVADLHELPVLSHDIRGMLFFLTGNCHICWKVD